jgi:hypothetical protein
MANPANSTAYRLPDGRMAVNVTEAKALGIADSGIVQNVIVDGIAVTLPATATQGVWPIRAGGVPVSGGPAGTGSDGSMSLEIAPQAADRIQGGPDGTATDDKSLLLAKAKMHVGDEIVIRNTGETNGPIVERVSVYDLTGLTREA